MGWPYGDEYGPGLSYAVRPPESAHLIPQRIVFIVYPVMGFPALVQREDELHVKVSYPPEDALFLAENWRVELVSGYENPADANHAAGDRVAQRYELPMLDVDVDEARWLYDLAVHVPPGLPEDTFGLVVSTVHFVDYQPAAVSVKDRLDDTFRFVHITDSQIADIRGDSYSNELTSGDYPGAGLLPRGEAMLKNVIWREFSLLRPDFAMWTGDMIFGIDPAGENDVFARIVEHTQVPLFLGSGNHDGYALMLGPDLLEDGLEFFARSFGPLYYSFEVAGVRFVMANSYDGTARRRQAGRAIVASPVDNWGGYLAEEQAGWLREELADADAAGATPLLFMHHDPRGPYSANEPYPTSPLGLDGEEFWNIDTETWDSNPRDGIADETPRRNTGVRTLRTALDAGVTHLFIGHSHFDALWRFAAGDAILDRFDNAVSNLQALAPFSVVMTTSVSAGVDDGTDRREYNGYRVVDVEDGRVASLNALNPDEPALSVPSGNLWFEDYNNDGRATQAQVEVTNGLPTDLTVTLEFYLAPLPEGYQILNDETQAAASVVDRGLGENGETVLYIKAVAPGTAIDPADFSAPAGRQAKTRFTARPHPTNQPPTAVLDAMPTEDETVYTFTAAGSQDPEGGDLRYYWDFGDGVIATGLSAIHRYAIGGPVAVTLTVLDRHGGQAAAQTTVQIEDCCPDREHDDEEDLCGQCGVTHGADGASGLWWLVLVTLGVAGLRAILGKRRFA
jgi:PKD repeat protein